MSKRPRSASPTKVTKKEALDDFDPVAIGLPPEFVLTDYTRLKGCSCKLPQPKLLALLQAVSTKPGQHDVGVDCSIVPIHHRNAQDESLFLVSTTDFFFPSVDDPFLQGQIGAANVLSDLYSMGIPDCDTVLMLLATSTDMDETEREVTTREMMRGFAERVKLADAEVTGGQTVMNPWPLIGGIAMRVVTEKEMVRPAGCVVPGDVLVLTKPLGGQLAVNLNQWRHRPSPVYEEAIQPHMSLDEIMELYCAATKSMKRLNRNAARLMLEQGAHGATDVTGFGILGHAKNFGAAQAEGDAPHHVCLVLERLPIFKGAVKASKLMKDPYRLFEGYSAETSGGLLVALPDTAAAELYVAKLAELDDEPAWIVGKVTDGRPEGPFARLADGYDTVLV